MVSRKFEKYFKITVLKSTSEGLLLRLFAKAALSQIQMRAAAPIINRKGISQSGFSENVTKFSRALNLSTEASVILERTSFERTIFINELLRKGHRALFGWRMQS